MNNDIRNTMNINEYPPVAIAPEKSSTQLPAHLLSVPGSDEWALWRNLCVRATGFPASHVLKLSAPQSAAAADSLCAAEDEFESVRRMTFEVLADELRNATPEQLPPLEKAFKRMRKNKLPHPLAGDGLASAAVGDLLRAQTRVESAREDFRLAYQQSVVAVSEAIHQIAEMNSFREAVTWQNRQVIHNGLDSLLRRTPGRQGRGSKQRQQEELVANYLQRYCVKNDTIGFFGPIGWARLVEEGETLTASPGLGLLNARRVYFESWAMDALGEKLASNKALREWVAPRRFPFVYLEGTTLHVPAQPPTTLPLPQSAVLHACDGQRTARQVAALVKRLPAAGLRSEAEVYRVLEHLCAMGLLTWTLEVPVAVHPEKHLRRQLERIEDMRLRDPALAAVAELEKGRRAVEEAAGDALQLDCAFSELENTFTRLTDTSSTRYAGKMYAARTIVYEDCRRDIEVEIGPEFRERLGPPLSLLLTSARWLTCEFAETYKKVFKDIYRQLVRQTGSAVVDCMSFWQRAQPILYGTDDYGIAERFQQRWTNILRLPEGERRVEFTTEELLEPVQDAFAATEAGWKAARYHSPDVMIGARSVEDIRSGDYYLVMGEMHLSSNTLGASLFMEQHPSVEEFYQALEFDQPEQRIIPLPPKTWQGLTTRTSVALISPKDIRLEVTTNSCGVTTSEALPIGLLVMEEEDEELFVRTRDGQRKFDVMKAFGEVMLILAIDAFKMLPREPHTPRVTFDRVVVCRETWSLAATEFPFAQEKDEEERFLRARRWARAHGMPRFVFVKVPVEVKPFYVDFESPIYIDIFAKMVRRTIEHGEERARISVTEMLPGADETWLPDAEGQHYTSELRIVAVDLAK
jgi:hypothetical protein